MGNISTLVSGTGDSVDVVDSDDSLLQPELILGVFAGVFTTAALLGLLFHHTYSRNIKTSISAKHVDLEAQQSDVMGHNETKPLETMPSKETQDCSESSVVSTALPSEK